MKRLFAALALLSMCASPARAAYYAYQRLGGPGVCVMYEKGETARGWFPLFKLQYPYGYSVWLCWWDNAPVMRGHILNRQQLGVCPVGGVKLNGKWIFTRECFAGDLFR